MSLHAIVVATAIADAARMNDAIARLPASIQALVRNVQLALGRAMAARIENQLREYAGHVIKVA